MTTEGASGARGAAESLLAGLTDPQREAVLHERGPLLVLAGAGSGKTRVITRRIARLVLGGVPPWRVLALTFTNKAAGEMKSRVAELLGGEGEGWRTRGLLVTTFHALCVRLLRRYAVSPAVAIKPDFVIYDEGDQSALMKRVLGELGMSATNWPPRSVLGQISTAKNALIDAAAFAQRAQDFYTRSVSRVYTAYERALRDAGAVDFDDLLLLTAKLLREDETARGECQGRWRHILIDEYQDTNKAQFQIANLIAGEGERGPGREGEDGDEGTGAGPNLCVVGDPDQSIYAWRGADIGNILDFETHYPRARVIPLGENFRSVSSVLRAADVLIRHNARRKHKDIFTNRPGGGKVRAVTCRDEHDEAGVVSEFLEEACRDGGLAWKDCAVMYRTNALSRVIEDRLRSLGIAYVIARGTAFYDRAEVRDALAYLRVMANPGDEVSLERIVNTPARGISDKTFEALRSAARERGTSVMEVMRRPESVGGAGLTPRACGSVRGFVEMIDAWTGAGSFMGEQAPGSLAELVERVVRESGLEKANRDEEERLANLAELVSSAREFEENHDTDADPVFSARAEADESGTAPVIEAERESGEDEDPSAGEVGGGLFGGDAGRGPAARGSEGSPALLAMLRAYLEHVSLVADADVVDPRRGAVTLLTLHAAKGLEFRAAAVIGLEEQVLPHARSLESEDAIEEERRLLYVGITRAMDRLLLTNASYRTLRGLAERTIESRFLSELRGAGDAVEFSDRTGGGTMEREWGESGSDAWKRFARGPGTRSARVGHGASGFTGGADRARAASGETIGVGDTVRHPQFGEGVVTGLTGGESARAQVRFRGVGLKTLVLEYARLERVK